MTDLEHWLTEYAPQPDPVLEIAIHSAVARAALHETRDALRRANATLCDLAAEQRMAADLDRALAMIGGQGRLPERWAEECEAHAEYLRSRGEYADAFLAKATTARRTARALRLHAATGAPHCACCLKPTGPAAREREETP